jgi:putative acetyltransferase
LRADAQGAARKQDERVSITVRHESRLRRNQKTRLCSLAGVPTSADPDGTDADLNDIENSYLRSGGCFDVLADANGAIIGSVGLYPIDSVTCELRKMYLSQQVRGQGQGKRLLEHALARAKDIGFRRVVLETASMLEEAIALYRRYGFRPYQEPHLSKRCDGAFALDLF